MTYIVNREFNHRTFGPIGSVRLSADATITLEGKELPGRSVEYLLTFALQSLQGAYAGAKSADEAKGAFLKKLDAVLEGTIGVRTGAAGVPAHWKYVREAIRGALKARRNEYDALEGAAARAEFLDELFKTLPEATQTALEKAAKERVKAEAEARDRAKGLDLDI